MANPRVDFVLLCEGSSGQYLTALLEKMLVLHGAGEAMGVANYRTGSVEEKLRRLMNTDTRFDVVFIHRDADGRDPAPRVNEIAQAIAHLDRTLTHVPVVPVQMTEAWLLADEPAIRAVVGNPHGTVELSLPKLHQIENIHDPKTVLGIALAAASEKSGRRLELVKKSFADHRMNLLQRLDPEGPIRELASWKSLDDEIALLAALGHWAP